MKERIAYITDIHLDEKFPIDLSVDSRSNLKTIINDIKVRGINKIIFGGDIGEASSNQWFFKSLSNFDLNIVLGNHDLHLLATAYDHRKPGKKDTLGGLPARGTIPPY